MTGTPILPPPKEEKKVRQVSKGLSVKDKNKMCSIMGFLLYLKESGKIDETEAKRLMEELPLYSISRIQTEFFGQEAFDLKKVEVELWKPMVAENKLNKKNKKTEEKEKGKGKPKKERKVKKNVVVNDDVVVDDVVVVVDDTKKRGRKAKKQIIEFDNNTTTIGEVKAKEDQLEELLNEMLETETETEEEEVVKVNEADLDAVLRELEEGELVEEKMIVEVVVPVVVKAKKDKKVNNKKEKSEEKSEEQEEPTTTNKKEKEPKKKVKISLDK
jgi:hypothetical protein